MYDFLNHIYDNLNDDLDNYVFEYPHISNTGSHNCGGKCGGNCSCHNTKSTTKEVKTGKRPNSQRKGMASYEMSFPRPTRVMFNPPTTTLFFDDGTITKVKAMDGDIFNKEHGVLYAFYKRLMGRNGSRDGMYGLMPSSGANESIRKLIDNATNIEPKNKTNTATDENNLQLKKDNKKTLKQGVNKKKKK